MRSILSRAAIAFPLVCCVWLSPAFTSAQTVIDWTAGGSNDGYNNVFNWTGSNVPNSTTETALFNLAGSYDVTLNSGTTTTVSDLIVQDGDINFAAGSAVLAFYDVDDDLKVRNGATFTVSQTGGGGDVILDVVSDTDVGGVAGSSLLRIDSGSRLETNNLFAGRNSNGDATVVLDDATLDVLNSVILGSSGSTGTLTFQNGSSANDIVGTTTLVSGSIAGSTGRLNVLSSSELNIGNIRVGSLSTSASAVQEATLTVDGAGSTLTQTGASTLTIGDATNPNVTADVIVSGGGEFNSGTGAVLIQNSGTLSVTGGTFNANDDVTVDGGRLNRASGLLFNLAAGKKLAAKNDALVDFTGNYDIAGGRTFEINSGADFQTSDFLRVGFANTTGPGVLIVDGTGSSVTGGGGLSSRSFWYDATVTFRNDASGDLETVDVGIASGLSADPNTITNVTIESGASVSFGTLTVVGRNSTTTFTVDGLDSTVTQKAGSILSFGDSFATTTTSEGTATINVQNGGMFTTGDVVTNMRANAVLNIGVVGTGTFVNDAGLFIDGATVNLASGSAEVVGTLDLFRSAHVNVTGGVFTARGDVEVGFDSTLAELATLTINGASAEFDAAGINHNIVVGDTDTSSGRIEVLDGGHWNDSGGGGDSLTIYSTGTVAIDGGSWTGANNITVDGGQMHISNGGSFSGSVFAVPDGDVVVDGENSSLTITELAGTKIGAAGGAATITFSNDAAGAINLHVVELGGGSFSANSSGQIDVNTGADVSIGRVDIGVGGQANQVGAVVVDDAGSTLTLNGINGFAMKLGAAATSMGTVDVIDSGVLNLNGPYEIYPTGALNVNGGTVNSSQNLNMEGGNVTIQAGGVLSGADAFIGMSAGSTGSVLTVTGENSAWNSTGAVLVGLFGSGTLNVEAKGFATSSFGIAGEKVDSEGIVNVTGGSSAWQITNDLIVGNFGDGTLTINGGGSVSSVDGFIGASSGSTGDVHVTGADSLLDHSGSLFVGGNDTTAGGVAGLTIEDSGLVEIDGVLKVWSTGTVNLHGGSTVAATIDHTDGGVFNFTGGTLAVDTFQGVLIQDGGTLLIGGSPGVTDVTQDYTINAGTLEIELFGGGVSPVAGVDFDQLTADTANLGGTLDLVIDPNYSPTLGDEFPIISTNNGVSGTFENVLGNYLGGGLGLDAQYNVNDVTVEVISIPLGDFDVDGVVDGRDFLVWQLDPSMGPLADWEANYGTVAPLSATSAAVPEPSTLCLLSIGGLLALRRFHRAITFMA